MLERVPDKREVNKLTRTIFTAGLATETNTFSPIPTGMGLYEATFLVRPPEPLPDGPKMETAVAWAAWVFADGHGDWRHVAGTYASAEPAGLTVRSVHESLRDEILGQLRAALPVDVVALGLHGAMVAEGCDDCEGDLLTRVREIVGPDVAVGAELDPHCHLTTAMTGAADVLVMYKEYPHIDFAERGQELVELLVAKAGGRIDPRMAVYDCRHIDTYHTTAEPMRSFVDRIQAMEGSDGVLSVSIGHGFEYGDVADLGTRVLVITDGDEVKGAALAEELGRELIAMRGKGSADYHSIADGLARAREVNGGTVVYRRQGQMLTLWIDGALQATKSHPDYAKGFFAGAWDPRAIGQAYQSSDSDWPFAMADFRAYDRALRDEEIVELYNP